MSRARPTAAAAAAAAFLASRIGKPTVRRIAAVQRVHVMTEKAPLLGQLRKRVTTDRAAVLFTRLCQS